MESNIYENCGELRSDFQNTIPIHTSTTICIQTNTEDKVRTITMYERIPMIIQWSVTRTVYESQPPKHPFLHCLPRDCILQYCFCCIYCFICSHRPLLTSLTLCGCSAIPLKVLCIVELQSNRTDQVQELCNDLANEAVD